MAKPLLKRNAVSSDDSNKRKVSKSDTIRVVQEVLLEELKKHGEGTIELVHRRCMFPKDAGHLIGIAVNGLAKAGHIVRVDLRHSKRSQAHGRFVSVWRLA
ncbi:MAG: hypothetical protein JNL58_05610 [Planctomyces sp.]|nr:hypothetical protein [Planctomyces sp.]